MIDKDFNRWWDEDRPLQINPYTTGSPMYWAWEGWQAGRKTKVDCGTCANRGHFYNIPQESPCHRCKWYEQWRTEDHYSPKVKVD
jgi:hypothetical protein